MKLYTKEGDAGFTSVLGTVRVRKDDARLEATGGVDELNCFIGHALGEAKRVNHQTICDALKPVGGDLFALGARLAAAATDNDSRAMRGEAIADMERKIDAMGEALPPLNHFILPGGCELACRLHLCRAVCRRTERAVVGLLNPMDGQGVCDPMATPYLNRLSDLLFIAARLANHDAGCAAEPWPPTEPEPQ